MDISALSIMSMLGLAICAEGIYRLPKANARSEYMRTGMPVLYAFLVALIAIQFFALVLPAFRAFPFSDDWVFVEPLSFHSAGDWLHWLWIQHVDHRIPIQKVIGYFLMRATGFDFRYFVGLNYLLAIAMTGMLLYVARVYRGFLNSGDMIIPLAALSFSAGYTLWGFQFQFISSIFFFGAFVALVFAWTVAPTRIRLIGAVAALFCAAWCGINGLLFATIGTLGMLMWFAYDRGEGHTGTLRNTVPFVVVLAVEAFIWLMWTPASATGTALDKSLLFVYIFHLVPAAMGVFGFDDPHGWKFALVAVLFVGALLIGLRRAASRTITLQDFVLVLAATASFTVMLSVAVGRSKVQGDWNSVTAMHYGSMSIFLPACSWLIVSKRLGARAIEIAGIALAAVYFCAFMGDSEWRDGVIATLTPHQQQVVAEMESGADAKELAKKYRPDFTFDPHQEAEVATDIQILRGIGARMYGGK